MIYVSSEYSSYCFLAAGILLCTAALLIIFVDENIKNNRRICVILLFVLLFTFAVSMFVFIL